VCLTEQGSYNTSRAGEMRASNALLKGDRLASEFERFSLDRALAQYKLAQSRWLSANDVTNACAALTRQGEIYSLRGDLSAALSSYREALSLLKSRDLIARTDILNAIGNLEIMFGRFDQGQYYASLAHSSSSSVHYREGQALALTELGAIAFYRKHSSLAQSYLDAATMIWTGSPNRYGQALTLVYTSYVSSLKSQYTDALQSLQTSLRLSASIEDHFSEARTLADVGNLYLHLDELDHARRSYNDSLYLMTKIGNNHEIAYILDDFGAYLERTGESSGFEVYRRAASLAKGLGDDLLYGEILSDLSRAAVLTRRAHQALQYSRVERLVTARVGEGVLVSQALRDTGEAYMLMGQPESALPFFRRALAPELLDAQSTDRPLVQIEMARSLERLNHGAQALELFREATAFSHRLHAARTEADARYNVARLEAESNLLTDALVEIEQSVGLIESLRDKVRADDTRVWWFASFHSVYELYIDILMRLFSTNSQPEMSRRAFEIAERSTARSFVELLREAQSERSDPDLLIQERASVRQMLATKAREQVQLLAGGQNAEIVNRVAAEVHDLSNRDAELDTLIAFAQTTHRALQSDSLGAQQAQSLLGDGDVILEFSLGGIRSYLWVITRTGFSSYTLPPRSVIESLVRKYRDIVISPHAPLLSRDASSQQRTLIADDVESNVAKELGRMLIAPAADAIRCKRIVVVADGSLQYLSFGALILPSNNRASGDPWEG
jgi:tetratricopeptide (TPR) repeat protein